MRRFNPGLWKKQDGCCFYCGIKLVRKTKDPEKIAQIYTLDHYIPRKILTEEVASYFYREGQLDNPNLVYACQRCNNKKGDKLPIDWNGKLGPYCYTDGEWFMDGTAYLGLMQIQIEDGSKYTVEGVLQLAIDYLKCSNDPRAVRIAKMLAGASISLGEYAQSMGLKFVKDNPAWPNISKELRPKTFNAVIHIASEYEHIAES